MRAVSIDDNDAFAHLCAYSRPMNWMNRALGYAIAAVIAGGLIAGLFALFGTAVLGAVAAALAIPLAFPLTTLLVISVIGIGVVWAALRRRKQKPPGNARG